MKPVPMITAATALSTTALMMGGFASPAFAQSSPGIHVDWQITQDWGSGYQGSVTVRNDSTQPIQPWSITVPYSNTISSTWDATATSTAGGYRFTGPNWNRDLVPGTSITFGFIGSSSGGSKVPTTCLASTVTCAVNEGSSTSTTSTPPIEQITPLPAAPSTVVPASDNQEISVAFNIVSDWGSGRTIDVTITNKGTSSIPSWTVKFPWKGSNVSAWNAQTLLAGGSLTASSLSWNGALAPGASASFGFNDSGDYSLPATCEVSSGNCAVSGAAELPAPQPSESTPPATTDETPAAALPSPAPVTPTSVSDAAYSGSKKIVAYYPSWATYARNYQVADIPADKITHINFAFANIADGKCVVGDSYADTDKAFAGDTWDVGAQRGNFNQLTKLKNAHPELQTLISIGGWTWSKNFPSVAADSVSREKFVSSCVDFMTTYGFDGIDIDWEYPVSGGLYPGTAADTANYTALLSEFKAKLAALSTRDGQIHPLTIAAPQGPTTIPHLDASGIAQNVDWMNLMSYDYHGGWDTITGHNAPMNVGAGDHSAGFSITDSVNTYLSAGFPAGKLVLGLPLYGRGWMNVTSSQAGLFQQGSTANVGTWENGVFDYTDIKNNYLPTMTRYWDTEAQVPYLYDASRQLWISYDDPESIKIKVDYINSLGLGGAMVWELSGDRENELLDVVGTYMN